MRALASHQHGPSSFLVLASYLGWACWGFSQGTLVFPSPQKPTFSNSNSVWWVFLISALYLIHCHLNKVIIFYFNLATRVQQQQLYLSVDIGEQGWCSGESTRLPPMWPGFDSRTRRHMWVEFVVGSRPCTERFFSSFSGFPLSSKTNIFKIPIRSGIQGPQVFQSSDC